MSKAKLNAMQARLNVLSLALAALAREVPAERAVAVQDRLRRGLQRRLNGGGAVTAGGRGSGD